MLLVFDVGNTNIVLGVFRENELISHWSLATDRQKTIDEYAMIIKAFLQDGGINLGDIDGVTISSVVPPLTQDLIRLSQKYFHNNPLVIGPGVKTGLSIKLENPKELGADRIVNAVAGLYLYGGPLIIIDFGTATTFCAISQAGEFLGGAIASGIGISAEALYQKTAKLPKIELIKPEKSIGRNTTASMQSGVFYGYLGLVEGLVQRIKSEMETQVKVVATGGFAELIAKESAIIDHVAPDLTLIGLRLIYERNRKN